MYLAFLKRVKLECASAFMMGLGTAGAGALFKLMQESTTRTNCQEAEEKEKL